VKLELQAISAELLPCLEDGEVAAEQVTFVDAVQAPSAYKSCVNEADRVTNAEPLVQVAVPLLVVEALPIVRTVSPAVRRLAALAKVFNLSAKETPVLLSEPPL
jgi:hypothetical protein